MSYGVNGSGGSNQTNLYWQWANYSYPSAKRIDNLGAKIMITDALYSYGAACVVYGPDVTDKYSKAYFLHNNLTNVLFTDGHIKSGTYGAIYGSGLYDNNFRWRYSSPNN